MCSPPPPPADLAPGNDEIYEEKQENFLTAGNPQDGQVVLYKVGSGGGGGGSGTGTWLGEGGAWWWWSGDAGGGPPTNKQSKALFCWSTQLIDTMFFGETKKK